jgi:hypothetical protein
VSDVKEREQEQATRSQAKLFKLKMALGVPLEMKILTSLEAVPQQRRP